MAQKFKDRGMNDLYNLYRDDPPRTRASGGLAAAYWRGHDHPEAAPPYDLQSLAHAAWSAGRTFARQGARVEA